jgi:hypothetical protein
MASSQPVNQEWLQRVQAQLIYQRAHLAQYGDCRDKCQSIRCLSFLPPDWASHVFVSAYVASHMKISADLAMIRMMV